jgi:hypothetical protein
MSTAARHCGAVVIQLADGGIRVPWFDLPQAWRALCALFSRSGDSRKRAGRDEEIHLAQTLGRVS